MPIEISRVLKRIEKAAPNVIPKDSGIPNVTIFYSVQYDNHPLPRVKVTLNGKKGSTLIMSVGPKPKPYFPKDVHYSELGYDAETYHKLVAWIILNKYMLGRFWQAINRGYNIRKLKAMLKPLPKNWKSEIEDFKDVTEEERKMLLTEKP